MLIGANLLITCSSIATHRTNDLLQGFQDRCISRIWRIWRFTQASCSFTRARRHV